MASWSRILTYTSRFAWRKAALKHFEKIKPEDVKLEDVLPIFCLESEHEDFELRVELGSGLFSKDVGGDQSEALSKLLQDHQSAQSDIWKHAERVFKIIRGQLTEIHLEDAIFLQYVLGQMIKGQLPDDDTLTRSGYTLSERKQSFQENLTSKTVSIWFSWDEVVGLGESFLKSLHQNQEREHLEYAIPIQPNNVQYVLTWAEDEGTRRTVWRSLFVQDNEPILYDILEIRGDIAEAAQQTDLFRENSTHAHTIINGLSITCPEDVVLFLTSFRDVLVRKGRKEKEELLLRKKTHLDSRETPNDVWDGRFYPWDFLYYDRLMREDIYCDEVNGATSGEKLDDVAIAQFFPLKYTIRAFLRRLEPIFGLLFIEITDHKEVLSNGKVSDLVWHDTVQAFSVWNSGTVPNQANGFLGYIYLDLLPREGKPHTQPYELSLRYGFLKSTGFRSFSRGAIISSFVAAEAGEHVLLSQKQVIDLFHELGHAIHSTVSKTKYSKFHGARVLYDFLEVPGKMFENWCWIPSEIQAISLRRSKIPEYELKIKRAMDEHEHNLKQNPELLFIPPSPDSEWQMTKTMAESLAGTRNVNTALKALKTVASSEFALGMYGLGRSFETTEEIPMKKLWKQLLCDTRLFDLPAMEDEAAIDGFEYSAVQTFAERNAPAHYRYIFGDAMAYALFQKFKDNPTDAELGMKFRKIVLEPGGTKDPMKLMEEFLGEKPSVKAYFDALEIDIDQAKVDEIDALFSDSKRYSEAGIRELILKYKEKK